jgi:hypothetical protein
MDGCELTGSLIADNSGNLHGTAVFTAQQKDVVLMDTALCSSSRPDRYKLKQEGVG